MSAGGESSKPYRERCRYTGESYQKLRNSGTPIDKARPVPDATGDQAMLESQVMQYLATGSVWAAHPFGIFRTEITSGGTTIVHLDNRAGLIEGRTFSMASHAVQHLLPSAAPGVQVDGAPGLRAAAAGRDLLLTQAEGSGSVVLRAVERTSWEPDLSDWWRQLNDGGCPPLWGETGLTVHERDHESKHSWVTKNYRDLAWLGSGLLRRIALFHGKQGPACYSVRSEIRNRQWRVDLSVRHDVPFRHGDFLKRLINVDTSAGAACGLPLRVSDSFCCCDSPVAGDRRYTRECVYHLEHDPGTGRQLPGALQLRFIRDPEPGSYPRVELEAVGADREWLDVVMPRRPSGGSSEARP